MFVNEINAPVVAAQQQAELRQRAADERLARVVLRARREGADLGVLARIGRLFAGHTISAPRHRTAH